MTEKQELNHYFFACFDHILNAEERALEKITNGTLTIKDVHLIEAVFKSQSVGENCFSTIAELLKITTGTLTSAFSKLEKKGYLYKEQDRDDKRIYYIVPTRLAEVINEEHKKFHDKMTDDVSKLFSKDPKKVEMLLDALKKLDTFFTEL
jgi:DNA-binding MarR family transcriptional regulator